MSASGERTRITEQIGRLRALIDGLEMTIKGCHPCSEAAQVVADGATRLVAAAARHDAYQRSGKP